MAASSRQWKTVLIFPSAELVAKMVGREIDGAKQYSLRPEAHGHIGEPVLELRGLSVPGHINHASLVVSAGEDCLVWPGFQTAARISWAEAIFGLVPRGGTVEVGGIRLAPERPSHALSAGIALVPADRRSAGALLSMTVAENTVSSTLRRFVRRGFLSRRKIEGTARDYVARLDARVASLGQKISTLSGGNQQKIILARSLVRGPRVADLCEEPDTSAFDVFGAKSEIYRILEEAGPQDGWAS